MAWYRPTRISYALCGTDSLASTERRAGGVPGYLKNRRLPPSYETDDMVLPRVFAALDAVRKENPGTRPEPPTPLVRDARY